MENMNLFDVFGIQPIETTGKEKQKKEKKQEKRSNKGAKKEYLAPITVYSGFHEPLLLSKEILGTEAIELSVIKQKVAEKIPEFVNGGFDLEEIDASNAILGAYFLENKKMKKGKVALTSDSQVLLGNCLFDVSSLMTEESCEVDISEIQKVIAQAEPDFGEAEDISFYVDGNRIVPKPEFTSKGNAADFPVRIHILGRDTLEMSQEENPAGEEITMEGVTEYVAKQYPEFSKEHMDIRYNKTTASYVVTWKKKYAVAAKAATMYPTDATISLLFTRIQLEPEMFGGEAEVEEKEILRFLQKDYPEYSKERTELIFDEKRKVLMPVLKGSKKGASLITSSQEEEMLLKQPYALYEKEIDGKRCRCENKTEAFYCVEKAASPTGFLRYKLPKVPYEIYAKAEEFFRQVSMWCDTEAALELYWDTMDERYVLICPKQRVARAHLYIDTDCALACNERYVHVIQMHSHGRINCSFSRIDDEDEIATMLYGVFYGYTDNASEAPFFDLRMSCGGYRVSVAVEDIFETSGEEPEGWDFSEYLDNLTFL